MGWKNDLEKELGKVKLDKKKTELGLATRINDMLSKKYYWRDWLVVVWRKQDQAAVRMNNPWSEKVPEIWKAYRWRKHYKIYITSVSKTRRKKKKKKKKKKVLSLIPLL